MIKISHVTYNYYFWHTDRLVCFMENTKEYIIDEAFKLFLTRSYEAVSISDISKVTGMTKGALYHHFKSKEELFKMVIDKYLIIPAVDVGSGKITLYEFIHLSIIHTEKITRGIFENFEIFTPLDYISLFSDALRHYPNYDKTFGEFINKEIEKITIVLQDAILSGEIRSDINVSIVASNFFSFSMGLAGSIVRNYSIEGAINILREQNLEYYKLLKLN